MKSVLFVVAHPDDVAVAMGGLRSFSKRNTRCWRCLWYAAGSADIAMQRCSSLWLAPMQDQYWITFTVIPQDDGLYGFMDCWIIGSRKNIDFATIH